MKTEELALGLKAARVKYKDRLFQHYKGGVYKVLDAVFDSSADEFALLYERVAGPHFNERNEAGIMFTRTIREFDMKVLGTDGSPTARFYEVEARPATVYEPVSTKDVRWSPPTFA